MKIKELLNFNPEAEIEVIFANGTPFKGKLTYGWSNGEGESIDNSKETATKTNKGKTKRKKRRSQVGFSFFI